jgi:hypothetical protein
VGVSVATLYFYFMLPIAEGAGQADGHIAFAVQ